MANQNKNDFDHKKENGFSPVEMYFLKPKWKNLSIPPIV